MHTEGWVGTSCCINLRPCHARFPASCCSDAADSLGDPECSRSLALSVAGPRTLSLPLGAPWVAGCGPWARASLRPPRPPVLGLCVWGAGSQENGAEPKVCVTSFDRCHRSRSQKAVTAPIPLSSVRQFLCPSAQPAGAISPRPPLSLCLRSAGVNLICIPGQLSEFQRLFMFIGFSNLLSCESPIYNLGIDCSCLL